ncbi:ABC transporter ATP-binding protein [bacterium]|nr:ABC transporter ATP-binding protein [bacterium]MDB4679897.1 ABC transporter ATP-binding protein [Planctomycetaceae bacterium]
MSNLSVQNLTKTFSTATGHLEILNGVGLEMSKGDSVSVTGPSGCGKSTLLYILGLLDSPTSGSYELLGENVSDLSKDRQADIRNKEIGFIFQEHHLLPQCTVLENVLIPTIPASLDPQDKKERAENLLNKVGLHERFNHRPGQLSGGERQRVAVCRSLINAPALLLADEPTGSLDPSTADGVGNLLLELASEQETMLLCVTHSVELADGFSRRLDLQNGTLVDVSNS